MNALTRFDTTALNQLNRALVGFDRMFNDFEKIAGAPAGNYPPYNVIKTSDDNYVIEVAVAGFSMEEIDVELNNNQLTITGKRNREDDASYEYLHRSLAYRDFVRQFTLADYVEVKSASIKDGILVVSLQRIVPEALKPRKIAISAN
jgi:molecular chaperone IbpA